MQQKENALKTKKKTNFGDMLALKDQNNTADIFNNIT